MILLLLLLYGANEHLTEESLKTWGVLASNMVKLRYEACTKIKVEV